MKVGRLIFAVFIFAAVLHAQEEKPWQIDRLCGKLNHVVRIPDRKNANTVSEKRTALRDVPVTLYEQRNDEPCCIGETAIETVRTGKGGHFEFKNQKEGKYWLRTNWNGKEYTLAVGLKPEKNTTTMCSQQGVDLDDEGKAGWWVTIRVD